MNLKESIRRILREEIKMPLQLKRRVNNDVLDELIYTVKSLIDSGYDESDVIYDTVRQFIATKQFKLKNDSEQSYWDSYIEVEEPLVDYVKSKLNIQESVLREETEGYKVNLVKKIIYTLYDNISFIEESTHYGRPLLIIYFESDDNAANIESWFDEKISKDIEEWTSGNIVVCPNWVADWDSRKKNADVFINTELIKYDNLGNVVNESVLREESSAKKKISALIDEYGLYDAAKMLGLSFTQIVKISDTPINPEIANQILIENMRKGNLTENYKEFIIHSSYDGVFYWETNTRTGHFSNDRVEQITVAATPFWDGLDYTPVEIDWFTLYDKDMVNPIYSMGGEGNYFKKFTHQTNFETVEELNVWYNEVYLPGVYDIIMNSLLPKVYRLVDYELNPR